MADDTLDCIYYSPYDRLKLCCTNWRVENARAVVLVVHGYGEHCKRYKHVATYFNQHHIAFVGFDFRGHGLSDGEQGFAPHLNALLDDLEAIVAKVRDDFYPDIPLILYGHGTGSVIMLSHLVRRPRPGLACAALVVSTPSMCLNKRPKQRHLFLARAFSNLAPHFRLPVAGNYRNIYANDPDVVEAYRNDPKVHDRWPASSIAMYLEVGKMLEKTTVQFPCPTLIQHGTADKITPLSDVRKWVRDRARGDVIYKEWVDYFHELHNDLGKEELFDYIRAWLEQKLHI
ncbi:unnamed protein product [Didymodactylos carnosus]|uniref:Serine aminopeptidase S33 domain-containing protein n=1 Tax=Didymodactylos carnosus TaxID=1234261 RepID=A0A814XTV5_9BILA|nr:unnamed protein product [Didymodactylos carnosus]CAF1220278.1 unnamed protein product [Didymodactylos carnosus]CAF3945400.1 unnamed protein product [Didymodactylos carnosus]CAF3983747.1 unnamed protein product [Didymodactylos carnosus]